MSKIKILSIILIMVIVQCKDDAHTGKSGVEVKDQWIRLVPESSEVTAGYATIVNHGKDNSLVGVESSISKSIELHEMKESEGMMKMRKVEDGFLVASHQSLILQSGGNHIMFIGLNRPLKENEEVPVVLVWKNGDRTNANFTVRLDQDSSTAPNQKQ